MTNVILRPATRGDTNAATAVIAAAYAPWLSRLPDLPDVTGGVAEDIAAGKAWVAVAEGRVVGVLLASIEQRVLHVANLAVDPSVAGAGIGTRLMRHAEAEAQKAGCACLRLATHPDMDGNTAFYQNLGWRVTDRAGNKVMMEKHLPPE